jgi:putative SOS response-associated peptidase YedK
MFGSFACEPRVLRSRREAWLVELKRDVARTVHPGGDAAVLSGDPRDGLALALGTMRWGLPNHAMVAKGLDPLDGALLFVPLAHASSVSARGRRCLVPLTSLTVHAPGGDRTYRDPDRPLLTLAALAEWIDRPEAAHRFGFLTEPTDDGSASYDAPLIVEPAHHDEWLDGWSKTEDLRSCGVPLRLRRMVVDEP